MKRSRLYALAAMNFVALACVHAVPYTTNQEMTEQLLMQSPRVLKDWYWNPDTDISNLATHVRSEYEACRTEGCFVIVIVRSDSSVSDKTKRQILHKVRSAFSYAFAPIYLRPEGMAKGCHLDAKIKLITLQNP